jgi:hypothetical protein
MKTSTLFLLATTFLILSSCKKEDKDLPKKSSFKHVYEFKIMEPSIGLETYCGNFLSHPGRVSGLVCPADFSTTLPLNFLVKADISENAAISPADSSWVDFSSPRQFTVTAEDGSDTTFWVTAGTAEGQWLKDGDFVDAMKFDLIGAVKWDFRISASNAQAFVFTIGTPMADQISGLVYDWNFQNFTELPKTVPFQPSVRSRIAGLGFTGGGVNCTDCTLTITELDLERGVFSGNWSLSFNGDVVNGTVGSFKNAPLYGEY